jgi:SAM-dependent methyltransferase
MAVLWHDLECGSYDADLPLWRELAAVAGTGPHSEPVLDVGAGTGRVALDLARRGHRVSAVERDGELLEALGSRGEALAVELALADAREFQLDRCDFAVCLMPMQTIQLLGGARGRAAFLSRARAHLRPGGLLACAIVTEIESFDCTAGDLGPLPEIASAGNVNYISRAVRVSAGRGSLRIERERSVHAPGDPASAAGSPVREVVELDRLSAAQLEREGRAAGLSAAGTRAIAATSEHSGSVVVMFHA